MWDDRVLTERHYVHNEPVPNYFLIIVLRGQFAARCYSRGFHSPRRRSCGAFVSPAQEFSARLRQRRPGIRVWNAPSASAPQYSRGHGECGTGSWGRVNGIPKVPLPLVPLFGKNTLAI